MNKKTSGVISDYIISELLTSKSKAENVWEWRGQKPQLLIQHLREGNAKYLSQEVWVVVANYLEENYKKGNKRPIEDNYDRDKFIIEEYKNIIEEDKKNKETRSGSEICRLIEGKVRKKWGRKKTLDGIRPVGESQIRKIIDEYKEEQKLADEFENHK